MKSNERKYSITIFDEDWQFTKSQLKRLLTREAYDIYFSVFYKGGVCSFGLGSLCSPRMLEEVMAES